MNLALARIRPIGWLSQNPISVALVILVLFLSMMSERFFSVDNATAIFSQIAAIGILAIALGLLVLMGGIDLSVGSVASCAGVIAGKVMVDTGSWVQGAGSALAFGLVAGVINGLLIAYANLNSIVVTLGFLSVWAGAAFLIADGQTVTGLPGSFGELGLKEFFGFLPIQVAVLAVVVAIGWWVLNRTAKGREMLAVGGSPRAAQLMGINVRRMRLQGYAAVGLIAGFVGLMLGARVQVFTPNAGAGLEISALTIVLLGGVAFDGGTGRVGGIVVGILFFGVMNNGMVLLGVQSYMQTLLVGATLLFACTIDRVVQNFSGRGFMWRRPQEPTEPGDSEPQVPDVVGAAR